MRTSIHFPLWALLLVPLLWLTTPLSGDLKYAKPMCLSLRSTWRAGPDQCGSVGWASSRKMKGHQFDSWSGHKPGLQVWSPVAVSTRGNRLMFLSHIHVSLTLFLPLPSPPSFFVKRQAGLLLQHPASAWRVFAVKLQCFRIR